MLSTNRTCNALTSGGSRTAASPGGPYAKKGLYLQNRVERDWQPVQFDTMDSVFAMGGKRAERTNQS